MNPKFPIYVISKGRAENCLTAMRLSDMKVKFTLVVEPQEYDAYRASFPKQTISVLPFSNLGQGSIPARNWVWSDALARDRLTNGGAKRHWILDDNINGFERLNRNERATVTSGTMFRCAEDFADRYENVAFAGFEYRQFAGGARRKKPPFRLNTRIYSCILVKTDLQYRWRGKYNEDTDISLRALRDGLCTVLFQCFLQNKAGTMTMKGGNTDTIYNTGDERMEFAKSLQEQHPDYVKVVRKFNRWHHEVNYEPFKRNKLIKRKGLKIKSGINNYGMKLVEVENG